MQLVELTKAFCTGQASGIDSFLTTLTDLGAEFEVTIQAFDARYIVSRYHLEKAIEIADREREYGNAIVRDRGLEIVLYAAGQRQIDRALEIGISPETEAMVVLVDGENETDAVKAVESLGTREQTLGSFDEDRIMSFYGITPAEQAATDASLEALVCERVALLVINR